MPMVVPIGLLCGRLIDRGLRPSPEAAGLAVGLYLTLLNSSVVGRGIRFVTQGMLSPSPPIRFVLAVGMIGTLIAVVYRKQWLPSIQPQIDLARKAGVIKRVFTILLVVLVLLHILMADLGVGATTDQKQLGQRFHATTPSDAIVYIHPSAQTAIYTFVFNAQRPLREATLKQLNTNPNVQYALVDQSVAESLYRAHERVGTMTVSDSVSLVLVELEDINRSSLPAPPPHTLTPSRPTAPAFAVAPPPRRRQDKK